MRAVFLLTLFVVVVGVLALWGKTSAAYTVLQVGEHLFAPVSTEEILGSREQMRSGARHERRVTPLMKKIVAAKHGWRCACGCREQLTFDYHVDHILPLWKGGSNEEGNLQPLNPQHHAKKTSLENQRP